MMFRALYKSFTIESETAVAMEIIDLINIHIHVYVDNHQNDAYFETKMKLFAPLIEFYATLRHKLNLLLVK